MYEAKVTGEVKGSSDETKQVGWYNQAQLKQLEERTNAYRRGELDEKEWETHPGLEPVWLEILTDLKVLE